MERRLFFRVELDRSFEVGRFLILLLLFHYFDDDVVVFYYLFKSIVNFFVNFSAP